MPSVCQGSCPETLQGRGERSGIKFFVAACSPNKWCVADSGLAMGTEQHYVPSSRCSSSTHNHRILSAENLWSFALYGNLAHRSGAHWRFQRTQALPMLWQRTLSVACLRGSKRSSCHLSRLIRNHVKASIVLAIFYWELRRHFVVWWVA